MTTTHQPEPGRTAPREPDPIRTLPHDKHGRPIPWFVHRDPDGTYDFRVIRAGGIVDAVRGNLCWVCGTRRGRETAFVIGPMCAINRVSSEPPAHRECARYSADACPFLSVPHMRRRDTGLPVNRIEPAGVAVMRNPGVACVWFTNSHRMIPAPGGVLFEVGAPTRVTWRAHGRDATRAEILASIDSGYPLLVDAARADRNPDSALAELEHQRAAALRLLPAS